MSKLNSKKASAVMVLTFLLLFVSSNGYALEDKGQSENENSFVPAKSAEVSSGIKNLEKENLHSDLENELESNSVDYHLDSMDEDEH